MFPIYVGDTETPIYPQGPVTFKAAVQAKTAFFQVISNAPEVSNTAAGTGNGYVVGYSTSQFWGMTADKTQITIASNVPENAHGAVEASIRLAMRRMEPVRRLGLVYCEAGQVPDFPRTLRWNGTNEVTADTEKHGQMNGRVTRFTNGCPQKIQLEFSGLKNVTYILSYTYKDSLIPHSITTTRLSKGENAFVSEYVIQSIDIGETEGESGEFGPEMFVGPNAIGAIRKRIVTGTNAVYIEPDGTSRKSIQLPPDHYEKMGIFVSNGKVKVIRILLFCVFIFLAPTIVYYFSKHQNK